MEFQEFPKIGRLSRDMVITEKIDGTNGVIGIEEDGTTMHVGSRSRWLTMETSDNHGFLLWATLNRDALLTLGPGRHFGEWWGAGIQRRYGLTEKRFSLFNVGRWVDTHTTNGDELLTGKQQYAPSCCHVVPVLMRWTFSDDRITETLNRLREKGSKAAPGFMDPEGIVVFHSASGTLFKKTLDRDGEPKSKVVAATVSA